MSKEWLTKQNIIKLLLVGILLLAIPFSISLLSKTQIFKSKAAAEPITFKQSETLKCDSSGQNCTSTGENIELELRSPLGAPAPAASAPQVN